MAHYVMSDIHGDADRFHAMLEKIQLSPDDTLYILGDVIDRGPDGIPLLREIMAAPNMVMLLGNHEYMMLDYLKLKAREQQEILDYLQSLPTHLEVEVSGQRFYLVHGFPGANVHDEVWHRPEMDTPNPIPGCKLIIGHTPVLSLIQPEEEKVRCAMELESRGRAPAGLLCGRIHRY